MYIRSIKIKNIRSIKDLKLDFKPEDCPGWHVLIGDNGSGKSTVAKAIALGLIGPDEALALREDWKTWLRQKSKKGMVELTLLHKNVSGKLTCGIALVETNSGIKPFPLRGLKKDSGISRLPEDLPEIFSASYGPIRRFEGDSQASAKLKDSYSRLLPHLPLFSDDFALSECLEWIEDLRFKELEGKREGDTLPLLKQFINEGELLPGGAVFKQVTSDGVVFEDPNGCELDIGELSDGYRSILSLTFDLIRLLVVFYGYKKVFRNLSNQRVFIDVPGVVLIDEIDAHLHPSWQKRIGYWLTRYFPKIQFIVTTHSPLVCHAAENGSVWRLAAPGSEQTSGRVAGTDLQRLLYGNIVEAMDTELFGRDVIRSQTSQKKLARLEKLNLRSLEGEISDEEVQELHRLRAAMPTAINIGITRGGAK